MKSKKIFSTVNVWLSISICINLYLLSLPLTSILGYEYSAVNGIIQSFISGIFFLHFNGSSKNILGAVKKTAVYSLLNFVLIFFLGVMSTVFFQGCPFDVTAFFYFLIPPVSILLGVSIAVLVSNRSKLLSYLFFIVVWLLLLASAILEFYFYSQIYFFNPIIGYFPGTIYDEDMQITSQFVLYRTFYLLFSFTFLVLVVKIKSVKFNNLIHLIKISFILFLLIFEFLKPELNMATSSARLKSVLSKQFTTEHFEIFADPTVSKDDLNYLSLLHEYYYTDLVENINVQPSRKIASFIFKDSFQKREFFGAGNANVAKPWMSQIFLNREQVESSLKHEIVHIFAAEFGWSIFEVAKYFNPAVIEGFAMAFEDEYAGHSVDYMAKLARTNGYDFKISDLFSGLNFYTVTSSISYIYAGSFIKYLKDFFGVEKIKKLYSDGNFEQIFDTEIIEIQEAYYDNLDSLEYEFPSAESHYFFGRPSIFTKYCVRYTANQIKGAWSDYSAGAYESALEKFTRIFENTSNHSSLRGMILSLGKLERYFEASEIIENNFVNFKGTAYEYDLKLTLAVYSIRLNDLDKAKILLKEIIDNPPTDEYFFAAYRWFKLISWKADFINNFVNGSEFDKYLILSEMYKQENDLLLLPSVVSLSKFLDESVKNLLNNLNEILVPQTAYESKAIYELSEYLKNKYYYKESLHYLQKAKIFANDSELNKKYLESEKVLNWLIAHYISG